MAAKKENRVRITLACTECKQRNYNTKKNKKNFKNKKPFITLNLIDPIRLIYWS